MRKTLVVVATVPLRMIGAFSGIVLFRTNMDFIAFLAIVDPCGCDPAPHHFTGAVVFAWPWTADPARHLTAAAEERRLALQIVCSGSRLKLAPEEAWDDAMVVPLAEQLAVRRTGEM